MELARLKELRLMLDNSRAIQDKDFLIRRAVEILDEVIKAEDKQQTQRKRTIF